MNRVFFWEFFYLAVFASFILFVELIFSHFEITGPNFALTPPHVFLSVSAKQIQYFSKDENITTGLNNHIVQA